MKQMINREERGGWKEGTEKVRKEMKITEEDIGGKKDRNANIIKKKTKTYFKEKTEQKGREKSKVKHLLEGKNNTWTPGIRPTYMNKLTRTQASAIFKARKRMIDTKDNYKNKYPGTQGCRICNREEETQRHILEECEPLHPDETTKLKREHI